MTTASGSLIEGVDNEVLFAFLALIIITVLTVIYFLNVNRVVTPLNNSWDYLRTIIARETTGTESGENEGRSYSGAASGVSSGTNADELRDQDQNEDSMSSSMNLEATNGSHQVDFQPQTEGQSSVTGEEQPSGVETSQEAVPSTGHSKTPSQGTPEEGLRHRSAYSTSTGPNSQSQNTETSAPRLSLRVKHHEVERNFVVDTNITVGELKRLSFPDEVAQGRRVRFVYSGRLLHDDSANLTFYGITNYSVIHVQISDMTQQNSQGHNDEEGELDISRLFLPLLTFILCGCWYGLMSYRSLFNTTSTAILIIVTAAYALMVYVMFS